MIDTLRFRIPINNNIYRAIKRQSIEVRKYDYREDREIFRVSNSDLKLGSFDRKINIYLPDDTEMFLEFSLPKFVYGHNIFLLYIDELISSVEKVQKLLEKRFYVFPKVSEWQVYRIDLCYAWKFRNEVEAQSIMDVLSSFNFPRKKKSTYGTSVMFIGSAYSVKFYLKHDEFYKHDFRFLRDNGHFDFAYKMLDYSKGVVRFETTLRKAYLNTFFDRKVTIYDIPYGWYSARLFDIFGKTMGGFNFKYMKKREIKKRLVDMYGKNKGGRLYMFYLAVRAEGKKNIDFYAPSTIWRYLKEIKDAEVPLSFKELKNIEEFKLEIPDDRVVNKAQASAEARQLELVP